MESDDYDKICIVGRGTFGTVYVARDGKDGRRVILKQISLGLTNQCEVEGTMNEVKVLSTLKHPHIVEYYNSFVEPGLLTIVMEYASKGTLAKLLAKQQGQLLGQQDVIYLFGQLCLAVNYIHSRRILHRDISTQNVFLSGYSGKIVKLGDFGISKILESQSQASSIVGTPCYLSPELCQGRPYASDSDIWALGCVLYNMMTLRQAFQAPSLGGLVKKILECMVEPVDLTQYDQALADIVASMLECDPLSRPTAAMLMAHPLLVPVVYAMPTQHMIRRSSSPVSECDSI